MQESISDLYIFEGLSREEVVYFLMMSETIFLKAGETVISEGAASDDRAYIVQSGNVEILRWDQTIATLGVGELFGEIALITNEPRTATVRAKETTELLAIGRDEFLMLAKRSGKQDSIRKEIMRRIGENLKSDIQ